MKEMMPTPTANRTPDRSLAYRTGIQLIIVMTILTIVGCQKKPSEDLSEFPEESAKVAALRKEVIAVHDEVMPLMSDIYQLKKKLREKMKTSSGVSDGEKSLDSALLKLDSADRGMRVWMREFSEVKTTGVPEEQAISSLNAELAKVNKVKKDMIESVELATALTSP